MMNENMMLEPAAFLDMWQEKYFLGQEFLTWLWITSEINGNYLVIQPQGSVEVWFESRLQLESGEGGDKKSVTCQNPGAEWSEAYTALRRSKKLTRGRLKVRSEEKEWSLSLAADSLTPQGVKFPKTFTHGEDEEDDSLTGRFMERVALLNELNGIIEALFKQFLELRLSAAWSEKILPDLNRWLSTRA
ncbi:hypothetical protein C4J81_07875 [Deltaproteobacteria bacterium Smac51]|nr:hypothetical protein C4J81_07875 [Deltaproteobacteria bacterium Smac51]